MNKERAIILMKLIRKSRKHEQILQKNFQHFLFKKENSDESGFLQCI